MAEEEILQEAPVQKVKDKGEGIKLIHLILIGVVLIIITAASTMYLSRFMSKFFGSVDEEITKLRVSQLGDQARREGKTTIGECESVKKLTEKPIIVNMADGEHFISTSIAVCIDPKKVEDEEFEMRVPQMLHVINDSLSRIRKDDLFKATEVTAEDMEMAKELGLEETAEASEGGAVFAKNLNQYRGELIQ
ncbi:MAG: hypothetical protein AB1546_10495, partial [bacterium]